MLQCHPGTLKKDALLWVCDFGFTRIEAKEWSIEQVCPRQDSPGLNILRVAYHFEIRSEREQFLIGEGMYGFDPVSKVQPKLLQVWGIRKTSRQTNNRYLITRMETVAVTHGFSLLCCALCPSHLSSLLDRPVTGLTPLQTLLRGRRLPGRAA